MLQVPENAQSKTPILEQRRPPTLEPQPKFNSCAKPEVCFKHGMECDYCKDEICIHHMKPHLDKYHQEKSDKETGNEGDDEGTDTDKDGKSTDDESKKGDGKTDHDPADTEHEDNYDVMMGMWIPKRHLLECAIYSYEMEYGEGSATDLRKEFATRYGATSPCLAKAIENYKRFNNTKKATPKVLFNSGKSFEEWAEQKPILSGLDAAHKNVPSYDASIALVGLPDSKPDDKTGVGVCKWGERWYNKNKRLPDKLTVKCPPRWIGKGKDGH